jgi:hypothetical protein
MLNALLEDAHVLTQDFSLRSKNEVVITAQTMNGESQAISIQLGKVPCGPTATCYRLGSPHHTVPANKYIFEEDFDPKSLQRRVYLRRPEEKERRLIFIHSRGISECIGPSGLLALINSFPATKSEEVYAAALSSGKSWRIDEQAMKLYQEHAQPSEASIIVPNGEDMSPRDDETLLRMDMIYASVPTPEQAAQLWKAFQQWWYAVDSRSGKDLHEYRSSPPDKWWVRP